VEVVLCGCGVLVDVVGGFVGLLLLCGCCLVTNDTGALFVLLGWYGFGIESVVGVSHVFWFGWCG